MKKESVYLAICLFLVSLSFCAIFITFYMCRPKIVVKTSYGDYEKYVPNSEKGAKETMKYFDALTRESVR